MIVVPDQDALDRATRLLRAGELVAMPTETVYGLAGDARSDDALLRIFGVKERPLFDPLIVHVAWPPEPDLGAHPVDVLTDLGVVDGPALDVAARQLVAELVARFWPGPLTLVLPKHALLPDLVSSGLPTVAVRAPRHPVAIELLRRSGLPLAAPSANRFGRISPTTASDVDAELGQRVALILDGGACEVGIESTVVQLVAGGLQLLRPGGTSVDALRTVARIRTASAAPSLAQPSPGLLASHYAPRKPLVLLDGPLAESTLPPGQKIGLLLFSDGPHNESAAAARALVESGRVVDCRTLSPTGDVAEAARRLFAELRALDAGPAELLWAEPCAPTGLGMAILDRLQRAAAPRPVKGTR